MYLKHALILNSGSLADLDLTLEFEADGRPKPSLFVGRNGSGKSNFLAFVTDALFEIAAKKFTDIAPAHPRGGHQWHRIIGGGTIRTGSNHELALLRLEENEHDFTYVSKGGSLPRENVADRLLRFPNAPNWDNEVSCKEVSGPEGPIEGIFRSGCYVSFPTGRAEAPYWSGASAEIDEAKFEDRFQNLLRKPISVKSSINDLRPWLVDVLLDQMIDANALLADPQNINAKIAAGVANGTALNNVNVLLRTILGRPNARLVRTGRGAGKRKLAVYEDQQPLLPSLGAFSSGQAMLFGIFGTILRYADTGSAAMPMSEMHGIVVIDEVDAHLHADLQHDVLPSLMKLFPKVQFIVSAHSPLFPLGMDKHFGEGYTLFEMPSGTKISAERFSEFQSSFDYLKVTRLFEGAVIQRATQLHRPLVICEGQTDPKYFVTAAELLGFDKLINGVDFDWVGVMSDGQAKDGGEGQLRQAIKTLRNNPNLLKARTVFLFDCDQNDPSIDENFLHVRVLQKNDQNAVCDRGVENFLQPDVFEDRFFRVSTVRHGADETTKRVLDKNSLCDFLCKEKRIAEDFEGFRPALEMLNGIFFPENKEID